MGHVHALLSTYGYWAVLVIVMMESAGIPVPGETILVSAAIYAGTTHKMQIEWVIAAAACGAIMGDNIGFWVGREFGLHVIDRFGKHIGLDERRMKLGQYLFERHGGKIVFFGRFVAFLRAFAALLAGINQFPPLRFFAFNAAGGIVWASLFGLGGYFLGESIHRIAGPIGWVGLACAVVGCIVGWRFFKMHEERFLAEAEAAAARRQKA
ncbi:MAG: DedA family protein [Methylobacteriaceae bacterium]|nr:DedA family protein [Methylobacteriaceae bacterium]